MLAKSAGWAAAGIGAALLARRWLAGSDYSFRGRVALVAGGSRGLGLELARLLAREGAQVAICARDEKELERAEASMERHGLDVLPLRCDVTDQEQVRETIWRTETQLGPLDVLINNAGTISVGPVETMKLDDYERSMAIHFWGPLYATLAVLPSMQERGTGRIVNIASVGGKIGVPHLVPYCAGKFALVGFSRALRAEVRKDGVLVTTVCPGLMRTGSPRNADFKGQHKAEYAWFTVADSLPGLSMDSEQAARSILNASRRGDAEAILTLPAKLAVLADNLFPELSSTMLELSNRMLPGPGGIGAKSRKGRESESPITRSRLTKLTQDAARRNNQEFA